MGIKGIYAQLGPGERVSLAKLTADSFRDKGRPLRLAVDFAIWQFQNQAARGGTNPAIRTLFYRLVRLLGTPIQPIFVFDGPHKPVFKRKKRSGRGDGVAVSQAKRLIRLFGFPVHDAPAEAEAECALMQKRGIVDAVLSEDVDTIMFGCSRTLRNWSSEMKRSTTPTHVSLYDVAAMRLAELGLDREGMVLVALMSGGDYLPDGIPGCGVKVACEAAKAGFGKSLCRLRASDEQGLQEWRERLAHELRTNENNHFRTKHRALSIPDNFPNLEVLRYYTHPVVSPISTMEAVKEKLAQRQQLHLEALREFSRETFGWDYRIGAIKFIRVLGPALLVRNMLCEQDGEEAIHHIVKRRKHSSADGEPKLRLEFVPAEVVPIDLSQEAEEIIPSSREGLALNDDEEFEVAADEVEGAAVSQTGKVFDVTSIDTAWVLEDVVKQAAPRAFSEWEAAEQAKLARKSLKKQKGTGTKAAKASGMQRGALDKFVRTTKTSTVLRETQKGTLDIAEKVAPPEPTQPAQRSSISPPPREPSKQPAPSRVNDPDHPPADIWTSARSQVTPTRTSKSAGVQEAIVISSSPTGAAASPPPSASSRARPPPAGSPEVFGLVRSGFALSQDTKRVKSKGRQGGTKKSSTKGPQNSPARRFKQTSIDMFTTRTDPFSSSQSSSSTDPPTPVRADYDSDEDLPPLSSLISRKPLEPFSPSKRPKSPPDSNRGVSPPGPGKKKLLVPRTSAVGYFKEVEVDADERDETACREARRLERKGKACKVVRLSDVSFVDLTQEDWISTRCNNIE
ncbi:Flap endonuclease GEN-like protein [Hapsidospora chrysogenum ATCC 11550]|uniref:Flap endonuclease GEN-like protein n=1 Tax=Hapsidospora chrysogenum (strain ATCC 11550 / CBS 779.69 / DSM 880 / IAM 14645 / JCM 23072 / IMI 49137) TaxID=857340 RepID=A0A086TG52_HAPC1|nr:Flap endonuclease GEN-like protein [Hapsidospora chrysogenum ATCC 11550]